MIVSVGSHKTKTTCGMPCALVFRTQKEHRPFKIEELALVFQQATGVDVSEIFQRWLQSPEHSVRRTPKRGLRQVDFVFDGEEIRGLEQNPNTKSRWAQLARSGKKVMQFLCGGRYVANVVDGKVNHYGSR